MLARLLASLAAVLIAAIALLVNADIVARIVFDRPLRGVAELVAIAMPATVFLVLAWASRSGGLMRAGMPAAPPGTRLSVPAMVREAVAALAALLLSGAICAVSAPWLWRAWRDDEFLGVPGDFTVPSWPASLAVVLGSGLLALFAGADVLCWARRLARRSAGAAILPWLVVPGLALVFLTLDGRIAVGLGAVGLLFALLLTGMPVAFALLGAAALGIAFIKGSVLIALQSLGLAAGGAVSSYVFSAVPLFVLLGLVMARAEIGRDALAAAHWACGRLLGGLGIATVLANAIFAAMTGISIASAAIFSKVAVPPLIEHGFTPRFAVGLVAGSSVLGMLIPPSLLLIIYGLVAEVSINALFLAAVVPGLLLTGLFALTAIAAAWWRPRWAMRDTPDGVSASMLDARGALLKLLPILVLVTAVLGGIYGGIFTPTEAGAVGSLLALAVAAVMRRVGVRDVGQLLFACASTSASILFLIIAASAFGMMLTLSGIPGVVGSWIAAAGLGLTAYALCYLVLLVVLGMVLDSTSILLIMVPLALPAVQALGGDLIWFGIVTVIGVEIGLLTPPLGLSVYAIKAALDDQSITLRDIFVGALPFALLMLALTLLLIAIPQLGRVLV
ncbi:MAG: TRAP transporter large permease subunit [Gammaproteobacteria bacterium]